MPTLRAMVLEVLSEDSTFLDAAQGGVYDRPIVPPKQPGWAPNAWNVDPNDPEHGIIPCASVTDTDESNVAEMELIHATVGTVYVVCFGPRHDGGKTAVRLMKERAYELLNHAELWMDVEGRGVAELEWRESTKTIDSDRLPGTVEATVRFTADYLKRTE